MTAFFTFRHSGYCSVTIFLGQLLTSMSRTFNVMEACVENGIKRLVYSSSASVYGDAEIEPMTEAHPFNNKNFYGATKICGEAMLRAFHHRYGLNYVGLRYMNVYGPRQDYHGAYIAVIMKMLDSIDKGRVQSFLEMVPRLSISWLFTIVQGLIFVQWYQRLKMNFIMSALEREPR